jgi:subtilisin family serine protease
MRLDHAARLERLLGRDSTIQEVDGASGNGTLIRRDQLLVLGRDANGIHDQASRWVAGREDFEAAGLSVLHLRPSAKVNVCELTTTLSGLTPHRTLNAGPNHVMMAAPHYEPGPFDDPAPIDSVPTPPAERTGQREATVAILDTGIAEHPWFVNRKWFAACDDVREIPDTNGDDRLDSIAGHGTFIAGVILQQAPETTLVVDRIVEFDGVSDELALARSLAAFASHVERRGGPVDVVSLSLGCFTHDDKPSPILEHAINSVRHNTVIVACAGNANTDRPFWPAAMKRVIAVGSLDTDGHDRAPFSNYGWWVDACTMGDKVVSSFFTFDGLGPEGNENFNGYATWSGTSFAAPRVAGAIAARIAKHGISAPHAAADLLNEGRHRSMPDLGVLVDVPPGAGPA